MNEDLSDLEAGDLKAGLMALKALVTDVSVAFNERGKNVDHDLLAAQDLLNMLKGVPGVGQYARDAAIGIGVIRFVVRNADMTYKARPIVPEGHTGTEGVSG